MRMSSSLLLILALIATGYAALCALLYFRQESAIFFPGPNDKSLKEQYQPMRIEIASHGAMLEGWWIDNPQATNPITVLYFGGNAEDVLHTAATASLFNAQQMLFVNYRGYGGSTGKPSQEALYSDAISIYEYAIRRGARPEQLVVVGRSLGSAMASMLAASRPVRAAILVTPFDSLAALAGTHYPFLPIRLLLRHPFPSIDWARQSRAPALILAAQEDAVVPSTHAKKLFDAWSGEKEIHVLERVGHNDIERDPSYYRRINEFLSKHSGG
jgi:uncharacterized protein